MKVASQQEVAANFADYVKASQKGPVDVTKNGKPVAVLLEAKGDDDSDSAKVAAFHMKRFGKMLQRGPRVVAQSEVAQQRTAERNND